jgi:hypothetical protein
VNRILKRGRVETEDEFYDLKAVEDCSFDGGTTEEIRRLIADYEASVERSGSF